MADNVTLPGTGTVIAADDVGSVWFQQIKLVDGTLGSTAVIAGDAASGLDVDVTRIAAGETHLGAVGGHTAIVTVTPTLTVHATYVANDFVGESGVPMTFAVARVNAGSGTVISAALIDYIPASVAAELWLFDTTVTPPADSAAWTISDAHALTCIGVIPFSTYYASAVNSVSMGSVGVGIPFVCGAGVKNIFGCLVTRGAPAYINTAGDVVVRLGVIQD